MTYIFIFISNIINTSYPGGVADDGYLPLAKFCVKSPATPIKHQKNHNFSRKNSICTKISNSFQNWMLILEVSEMFNSLFITLFTIK